MIPVTWNTRWPALEPCAAVGEGEVAAVLARRLLLVPDDALGKLSGVAGRGLIVVLGPADELPWVDGVLYLGRPPDAPLLLLPTHQSPSVPAVVLQDALLARAGGDGTMIVALPASRRWVRLDRAEPIARSSLEQWLRQERSEHALEVEDAA